MEIKKSNIAFGIACLIAGAIVGVSLRGCTSCSKQPSVDPIIIHDTICVRDTVRIAAKTRVISTTVTDTLIVRDTDTVHVTLPLETKEYRDTFTTDTSRIELGVRYTGYRAKIDAIDLKSDYTIEPRVIDKKKGFRWFVGPSINVGYGVGLNGNTVIASPYVGVGVSVGWGYTFSK